MGTHSIDHNRRGLATCCRSEGGLDPFLNVAGLGAGSADSGTSDILHFDRPALQSF